jgi:hypothetical protein
VVDIGATEAFVEGSCSREEVIRRRSDEGEGRTPVRGTRADKSSVSDRYYQASGQR